jgi:hypothetical protein
VQKWSPGCQLWVGITTHRASPSGASLSGILNAVPSILNSISELPEKSFNILRKSRSTSVGNRVHLASEYALGAAQRARSCQIQRNSAQWRNAANPALARRSGRFAN